MADPKVSSKDREFTAKIVGTTNDDEAMVGLIKWLLGLHEKNKTDNANLGDSATCARLKTRH